MFNNATVTITSTDNNYVSTVLYTGIDAQVYKTSVNITGVNGEKTTKEHTMVLLDKSRTAIREGDLLEYTDDFSVLRKLKIVGTKMIKFKFSDEFIELTCERV